MSPTIYGYARVSTDDQDAELQRLALKSAGCATRDIFTDRGISGKFARRPALDKCLSKLQSGDTLVVWKLDRLGRDTHDLLSKVKNLKERGVQFRSLTESIIDTTSAQGELIFQIFAAFAQFERSLLLERTSAGRALAKQRNVKFGRPSSMPKEKRVIASRLYKSGTSIEEIAEGIEVSKSSVYRALREMFPSRFPRSKKKQPPVGPKKIEQKAPDKKIIVSEMEALLKTSDPDLRLAIKEELRVTRWEAAMQESKLALTDPNLEGAIQYAISKGLRKVH